MLKPDEKTAIIDCYIDCGNVKMVAAKLRRSLTTVAKVLHGISQKRCKKPPVKKMICEKMGRRIKKFASGKIIKGQMVTSSIIKKEFSLTCSLKTIQRFMKSGGYTYEVMKQIMKLSPTHKTNRVAFASSYLSKDEDFEKWIFSDEKKFNGDGPDNLGSYLIKNYPTAAREKRQCGGVSVMIIGCISSKGNLMIKVNLSILMTLFLSRLSMDVMTATNMSMISNLLLSHGVKVSLMTKPSFGSKTTVLSIPLRKFTNFLARMQNVRLSNGQLNLQI